MASLTLSESLLVSLLLNKQLLLITILAFFIFFAGKIYSLIILNSIEGKFIFDLFELFFIFMCTIFTVKSFFNGELVFLSIIKNIKVLINEALPLWLNGLILIIYSRLDQLYVGTIGNNSDMAEYGISITINSLALIIPTAVLTVIFPKMVNLSISDHVFYQQETIKLLRFSLIYGLLWVLGCHFWGHYFITLMYGSSYSYASEYLNILSFGVFFIVIGQIAGQWVLIEGKYWVSLKRSSVGIIIILLCYCLLGDSIDIKEIA